MEAVDDCGPCGDTVGKVVISGASGLLGRAIHKELFLNGYPHIEAVGLANTRWKPDAGLRKCDLTDFEELEKVFIEEKPAFFVHAAAERRPDIAEKNQDGTTQINLEVTKKIADLCIKYKCWLLFISTNAVFDGKNPPYAPNAKTNPLSHYGRTKNAAEDYVRATCEPGILRIPVLYGPVETLEESSISVIAKQILEKKPLELDNYIIYSPTYVEDVAVCIHKIINRKHDHCTLQGTWHFSAEERFTKFELAKLMGELMGWDTSHLTASDKQDPLRPRDTQLQCKALQSMGVYKITPIRDALKIVLEPWRPAQ